MDTFGFCAVGLFALVFGGLIWWVRRRDQQWAAFAAAEGGEFDSGGLFRRPTVTLRRGSETTVIELRGGHGDSSTGSTSVKTNWPDPQLRFTLQPRQLKIFTPNEMSPVTVGTSAFSEKFLVYSNDSDAAKRLFTSELQAVVERLAAVWGDCYFEISLTDDLLMIRKQEQCWTRRGLEEYVPVALEFIATAQATAYR